jgi:hypothetical protein
VFVSKDGVLEWPALSAALEDYPWAKVKVTGAWVPPRSATSRLARDTNSIGRGEDLENEGWLCEWFDRAPDSVEVVEEALGLGAYGRVLTIVTPGQMPDPDEEQERSWRRQRSEWEEEDT